MTFDLKIDPNNLDQECLRQVEMVDYAVRRVASLRKANSEADNNLELVEAQLKRAIRSDPGRYKVPDSKVTEGSIKEIMTLQPEYQEALKKVNEARHSFDLMTGMLTALDHRKRALDNLIDLWKQSYFNRITNGTGGEKDKVQIATKREIRTKGKPMKTP